METIAKFEVGKTYQGYVAIRGYYPKMCTVIKRTPSFVTFTDGTYTLKGEVSLKDGNEEVKNCEISISTKDLIANP